MATLVSTANSYGKLFNTMNTLSIHPGVPTDVIFSTIGDINNVIGSPVTKHTGIIIPYKVLISATGTTSDTIRKAIEDGMAHGYLNGYLDPASMAVHLWGGVALPEAASESPPDTLQAFSKELTKLMNECVALSKKSIEVAKALVSKTGEDLGM